MVDEHLRTKILFEISEIDSLLDKSSLLMQKCKSQEPDFIELSAVGSTMHSFYNGLENINRKPVLDEALKMPLADYMGFRHFFRHAYGYHIRWDLAKPLFENMSDVWNNTKRCIQNFLG